MNEPIITFDDYTFPYLQTMSRGFGGMLNRTQLLPGLDGGFDNFGNEPAAREIGKVSLTYGLASETDPDAMYSLIDEAYGLAWRGRKRLKFTPEGASKERFTFARVDSVRVDEAPRDLTHLFAIVSVVFEVSEPAWYVLQSNAFIWGQSIWGGGDRWGGGAGYSIGAPLSEQTITPGGTTWTYPRIWFVADKSAGLEIWNPAAEVIYQGNMIGRIQWFGQIEYGSALEIDCRRKRVRLDGVDAYANFETLRGYWLRFPPVQFTLRILSESPANDGSIRVSYWEAYG